MEQWILDQEKKRSKEIASEIESLNKEADHLADRLEGHMKDKQKRDFREQKASRGGRLVAGTGSKISPETHLPFVVVNARPHHRSADRPWPTESLTL